MPSYYAQVDGYKCDKGVIDACVEAVKGVGDGRISVADAKKVYVEIADGNKVTRCERWTFRYCLAHFHWTDSAKTYIFDAIANVKGGEDLEQDEVEEPPAKRSKRSVEVVDGMSLDKTLLDAFREAMGEDGVINGDDAKKIWATVVADDEVTACEKWTIRYAFTTWNKKWTPEATDYLFGQLKAWFEA
uniref:Uncharacterized protein n=1 Tax=Noctiluca scintillans TaxID=2966 RepID=A0A7S1AZU8_NOCSC